MALTKILNRSELGYDEVENIAKVGDGVSTFDELEPFNMVEVQNNVTSNNTKAALSAFQGKLLNERVTANENNISTNNTSINNIKTIVGVEGYSAPDSLATRISANESKIVILMTGAHVSKNS